jgi:hypothetical protein
MVNQSDNLRQPYWLFFIALITCAVSCKECDFLEKGFVQIQVKNDSNLPFTGTVYAVGSNQVVDSVVLRTVEPGGGDLVTLNLKRNRNQQSGTYRIVVNYAGKSLVKDYGSWSEQDDYYDTYFWQLVNGNFEEVKKVKTQCK